MPLYVIESSITNSSTNGLITNGLFDWASLKAFPSEVFLQKRKDVRVCAFPKPRLHGMLMYVSTTSHAAHLTVCLTLPPLVKNLSYFPLSAVSVASSALF